MDSRTQEFLEHVQSGGQVETADWMPDEYRSRLIKFIEMHAGSELMGVFPERSISRGSSGGSTRSSQLA